MFFKFCFHPIAATQKSEPHESSFVDHTLAGEAGNVVASTDCPMFIQNNGYLQIEILYELFCAISVT